jgi:hypothetical protein
METREAIFKMQYCGCTAERNGKYPTQGETLLLTSCSLFSLAFYPEDGGSMFFRNVETSTGLYGVTS